MIVRFAALVAALLLAACSAQPSTPERGVTVVTGSATLAAPVRLAANDAVPTPKPQVKQLSVEETARLHTDEMWSEPLDPTE